MEVDGVMTEGEWPLATEDRPLGGSLTWCLMLMSELKESRLELRLPAWLMASSVSRSSSAFE